jgi:hypothetical protein
MILLMLHQPVGPPMDTTEAWRRSGKRKCSCERCFYCDKPLDRHEHDHYPVPKRAGGSLVVASCLPCHDLKDRFLLFDWDIAAAFGAWQELLGGLPADLLEKLSSAKLGVRDMFALCSSELEARWDSLSPLARIAYAKMRGLYEDDLYLQARRDRLGVRRKPSDP